VFRLAIVVACEIAAEEVARFVHARIDIQPRTARPRRKTRIVRDVHVSRQSIGTGEVILDGHDRTLDVALSPNVLSIGDTSVDQVVFDALRIELVFV